MSFSFSGIQSGLDTSALVESLMYAERATVRRLQASQTRADNEIKAWDLIDKKLTDARTSIRSMRTNNTLSTSTASSSDESIVRASVNTRAVPGSYSFRVNALAAAQQVASQPIPSGATLTGAGIARVSSGLTGRGLDIVSDTLTDGSYDIEFVARDGLDLTIRLNGVNQAVEMTPAGEFTITAANGGELTLSGGSALGAGGPLQLGSAGYTRFEANATTTVNNLASALSSSGGPVRAQVIDTGDGSTDSYRLMITSRRTGTVNAADIDLSGLSLFGSPMTTIRAAADAEITLGDNALVLRRSSNTVTNAFPGITLDLVGTSPDRDVEITVVDDTTAQLKAVTDIVDGVNAILKQISAATAYNTENHTGAPLAGNSAARNVSRTITSAMGSVVDNGQFALLGQVGITMSRAGTYVVDQEKLRAAITNDPDEIQQMLFGSPTVDDDGVFDRLVNALDTLHDPAGRIKTARNGAEATIRTLKESIEMQEARLVLTEQRFTRQFTEMETAMAQLQSQSQYLAGALGSAR